MLSRVENKIIEGRSKKSQEKFADQCMAVSTTIANAVFVALLVYPFVELIKSTADSSVSAFSFTYVLSLIKKINVPLFCIFYLLPLYASHSARKIALDIYDKLDESSVISKLPKRKK
jgi:hypothetical protein